MQTSNLNATAWALTTRAELMALVESLENYFQAMDVGDNFEQRVTYTHLVNRYARAKETLSKGVWDESSQNSGPAH